MRCRISNYEIGKNTKTKLKSHCKEGTNNLVILLDLWDHLNAAMQFNVS